MDATSIFMWIGFILSAYAVVGNDSIQTLGTFLSSNEKRPWYILWLFAASILTFTLVYGWVANSGDVSYARLSKYPFPENFGWVYLLPPLVLMSITRLGIPVSTSFMILTFFNEKNLWSMMTKSVSGYLLAFGLAILIYFFITKLLEKRFLENPIKKSEEGIWTVVQWCSTGFLWSMWLIQDFANIYAYLPRTLNLWELIISLLVILGMLGYIFYGKGGKIQEIVKAKTNTVDIRSATIIDAIYGLVLLYFKELNSVPMSTTWVFIGLLAGREIAIRWRLKRLQKATFKNVASDLLKVTLGLAISIGLVFLIKAIS
jgi:hypothetical protein